MNRLTWLLAPLLLVLQLGCGGSAADNDKDTDAGSDATSDSSDASKGAGDAADSDRTGLAWTFTRQLETAPRGGTTIGPTLKLDDAVPATWQRLQKPGLSQRERDRRAIRALQGEYRVRFEFLETFPIASRKPLDEPYVSWATEYIDVIEERDDFLSLQHIMVMQFVDPDTDELSEPMVMKHWRQDWTWQPDTMLEFQGKRTWASTPVAGADAQGRWRWDVFQVDDSPRYSGIGHWEHFTSASVFATDDMRRPLPRRERSVRDDYQILVGEETLVVTPTAWYHEQRSFKQVEAGKERQPATPRTFLTREIGLNSYERIKKYDFSRGHAYWDTTAPFWSDVRQAWNDIVAANPRFTLRARVDEQALFERMFTMAADGDTLALSAGKRLATIREALEGYVVTPAP